MMLVIIMILNSWQEGPEIRDRKILCSSPRVYTTPSTITLQLHGIYIWNIYMNIHGIYIYMEYIYKIYIYIYIYIYKKYKGYINK